MNQHLGCFSVLLLVAFAPLLPVTYSGVPQSRYEAMMKRESTSNLGLYNATDKVNILNDTNFKTSVINQNHSSLVEFYNSYCGHCKRFAPTYKELAADCWPWRDVIKVDAIDCAAEENNDICREYEIMGYPTMRYFGPKYQPSEGNYGTSIETQDPKKIKDEISKLVMNETAANEKWPNFNNLTEDEAPNVFQELPHKVVFVVLVFIPDDSLSSLAAQTILNFQRYPQMQIRRISDEKLAGEQFHMNQGSRLCAVDRNMNMEHLPHKENTPEAYKESLNTFVKMKNLNEIPEPTTVSLETDKQNTLIDEELKEEQQRLINILQRYNPLGQSGKTMVDRLQKYVAENNQAIALS